LLLDLWRVVDEEGFGKKVTIVWMAGQKKSFLKMM
jgi:hypothetical protein